MRQILRDIAICGILAPSADNEHIFRLEFGDSFIRLWPTVEFATNSVQHRLILGLFSLGAVLENMRLGAARFGCEVKVSIDPGRSTTAPLAHLDVTLSRVREPNVLAASISIRCTNRRMYFGPKLEQVEVDGLRSVLDPASPIRLLRLNGDSRKRALSLIWRAESERFLRRSLHEEIFSSIRFDLPWTESAGSALPPGALEIEYPMRPMFKLLRSWPLMRFLNLFGAHHLIGLRAGWLPCWQAPGLFLVATSGSPQEGAIEAGSAFQRMWLKATSLGLAVQPLAASAILALQKDGDKGASASLRERLQTGWQLICPNLHPLVVFRVGRARQPTVRAGREALSHYLRDKSVEGISVPQSELRA